MRVDTSLLQGITAANQVSSKASTAALKSTGTTTSFSSALKSASEKETTKPVPGKNYAEILTGDRAGMYVNTSGGARDGEAFVLVKHDGREDHIYGTGMDRKVVTVSTEKSEATDSSTSTDKPATAERTKQVEGRAYADILNGARKGLYLNTSGNVRDGKTFVLVKRDEREYHIYGTGKNREIVSLADPAAKAKAETDTAAKTTDDASTTPTGTLTTSNPTSSTSTTP